MDASLFDKFRKPPKDAPKVRHAITNERQLLLKNFLDVKVDGIQLYDNKTKELRPIKPHELGIQLAHIPTEDLYAFFRQCEQAKNFSKYFWWSLKPKK